MLFIAIFSVALGYCAVMLLMVKIVSLARPSALPSFIGLCVILPLLLATAIGAYQLFLLLRT